MTGGMGMMDLLQIILVFSPCFILAVAAGYGLARRDKPNAKGLRYYDFSFNAQGLLRKGGWDIAKVFDEESTPRDFDTFLSLLMDHKIRESAGTKKFICQAWRDYGAENLLFVDCVRGQDNRVYLCRIFEQKKGLVSGDLQDISAYYIHLQKLFDRLRSVGQINHDLSNILTIINGYAYVAYASTAGDFSSSQSLNKIHSSVERGQELLDKLGETGQGLWKEPSRFSFVTEKKTRAAKETVRTAIILNMQAQDGRIALACLQPMLKDLGFDVVQVEGMQEVLKVIDETSSYIAAIFLLPLNDSESYSHTCRLIHGLAPKTPLFDVNTNLARPYKKQVSGPMFPAGGQSHYALNPTRLQKKQLRDLLRYTSESTVHTGGLNQSRQGFYIPDYPSQKKNREVI